MGVLSKSAKKYIISCTCSRENPELAISEVGSPGECFTALLDVGKLNNGLFSEAVSSALTEGAKPGMFSGAASFVLPDFLFSFDYITLPTIGKSKMTEAFKAEARTLYKNYADLVLDSQMVSQGKSSTTYRVMLIQKSLLTALKTAFSAVGLSIISFIPYSSACVAGAAKLNAAYRKTPSLLLVASYGYSEVIINGKDTLLGQTALPFGYEVLCNDRVTDEALLYYEKNAELAVINSREKARATKLTMAINIEGTDSEEAADKTEGFYTPDDDDANSFDTDDEFGENAAEKQTQNVKTATKRVTRTLPKFMRRPEPEGANEYILENFRLFEKRILLAARECKHTDYLPNIENVWLCLPDEFMTIAEAVGASEENAKLKWGNLSVGKEKAHRELLQTGVPNVKGSKLPHFSI